MGWGTVFGRSVNPIQTREADYAHCITTGPPDFRRCGVSESNHKKNKNWVKIPENWKLEIENFGKLNDLEVLDTLCEDVVGAKKGANSHLQSTANIAVCRHHFLT